MWRIKVFFRELFCSHDFKDEVTFLYSPFGWSTDAPRGVQTVHTCRKCWKVEVVREAL